MTYDGQDVQSIHYTRLPFHTPVRPSGFQNGAGFATTPLAVPPYQNFGFPTAQPQLLLQYGGQSGDREADRERWKYGFERYVERDVCSKHAEHTAQVIGADMSENCFGGLETDGNGHMEIDDEYLGCDDNQGHRIFYSQQQNQGSRQWDVYPTAPPQQGLGSSINGWQQGSWYGQAQYGPPQYRQQYVQYSNFETPIPLIPPWYDPDIPPLPILHPAEGVGEPVNGKPDVLDVAEYERSEGDNEATNLDGNIEMAEASMSALTISETPVGATQSPKGIAKVPSSSHWGRNQPMQYRLPRPLPSREYINRMSLVSRALDKPRPLLVVLDLNGALLRRKRGSGSFVGRPRLTEFLRYLLREHKIVIWSSAKPHNVEAICDKLFTPAEREKVVAIWARDKLRLGNNYNDRVQVYKQLSWLWADKKIQSSHPDPQSTWTQFNTVLVDDSVEKGASEPYNLLLIDEFEGKPEQMDTDVLGQVVQHLERLKWQSNVSAFLKIMPFLTVPGKKFDWANVVPHSPHR